MNLSEEITKLQRGGRVNKDEAELFLLWVSELGEGQRDLIAELAEENESSLPFLIKNFTQKVQAGAEADTGLFQRLTDEEDAMLIRADIGW